MTSERIEEAAASPQDPLVGTTFSEKYQIISRIGEGGMSVVYKARHLFIKKLVAIKMLQAHLMGKTNAIMRFQKEAEAVATLDHPNLIHVWDFGVSESGQPYLVMDYLEGSSMSDLLQKHGSLPISRALHIFQQTSDALFQAHSKGIVHRDLKPSNIMITKHGDDNDFVRVVDFGIAKMIPQEGEEHHQLTQTGEIFGSPLYMSPEQCTGSHLDARSDIYSLGCVIYESLTGQPPFKGNNPMGTIHLQLTQVVQPLTIPGCDARVRSHLDAVVFKAMEKDPSKRYQSMIELNQDLQKIGLDAATGRLIAPQSTGLARSFRRFESWLKNNAVVASVATVLLLAIAGAIVSAVLYLYPLLQPIKVPPGELTWIQPDIYARKDVADYNSKERIWFELIRRVKGTHGYYSPIMIDHLKGLIGLYVSSGKWNQAAERLEHLRRIVMKEDGPNSFSTGDTTRALVQCYIRAGDYSRLSSLEQKCRQVIAVYSRIHGEDSHQLAIPLSYLADVLERKGDTAEAKKTYKQAVKLFRDDDFKYAPERPMAYCRLADIYRKDGQFQESAELYEKSIPLWKEFDGAQQNSALALFHLAQDASQLGRFDLAETSYRKAIENMQQIWGKENPKSLEVLLDYEMFLEQRGRWIEALQVKASARELLKLGK